MFNLFKSSKNDLKITSPVKGKTLDITKVPDDVFAQKIVGDGVAVIPENGDIVAPCKGTITKIFKTNHAFTIETEDGVEVLVHLGIDTVDLKGEGFERIINVNHSKKVQQGDLLIKMDLNRIKRLGKNNIVILIITNMDKYKVLESYSDLEVDLSDTVLRIK